MHENGYNAMVGLLQGGKGDSESKGTQFSAPKAQKSLEELVKMTQFWRCNYQNF